MPEGAPEEDQFPGYWLSVAPAALSALANELGVPQESLEFAGRFHAEFWGSLTREEGAGHLGVFSGHASIQELVNARLLRTVEGPRRHRRNPIVQRAEQKRKKNFRHRAF